MPDLYHTFILCSYRASVILYFLTDFSRTNLRTHYCYGIIFHSFTQRSIFKEPKTAFERSCPWLITVLLSPLPTTICYRRIPTPWISFRAVYPITAFLAQVEIIAATNVSAIVLREKDLEETVYEALAKDCITLCTHYNKKLIYISFLNRHTG